MWRKEKEHWSLICCVREGFRAMITDCRSDVAHPSVCLVQQCWVFFFLWKKQNKTKQNLNCFSQINLDFWLVLKEKSDLTIPSQSFKRATEGQSSGRASPFRGSGEAREGGREAECPWECGWAGNEGRDADFKKWRSCFVSGPVNYV